MDDLEDAPPGTYVLRGGDILGQGSVKNLTDCYGELGIYGLCATAEHGKTLDELKHLVRTKSVNLMPALVDELPEGMRVVREPGHDWPDALIVFPADPTVDQWLSLHLVMTMREMISNPKHPRNQGNNL